MTDQERLVPGSLRELAQILDDQGMPAVGDILRKSALYVETMQDEIKVQDRMIFLLEEMKIMCIFCKLQCPSFQALKEHSAECKEHPLYKKLHSS